MRCVADTLLQRKDKACIHIKASFFLVCLKNKWLTSALCSSKITGCCTSKELWQQCSFVSRHTIHLYHFCSKTKMLYPNKSPGLWDSWTLPVVLVSTAFLHTSASQSWVDRGASLKFPFGSSLCRLMSETDGTAPHCSSSVRCFHSPLLKACWNLFLRQNWRNASSAAELLCGYVLLSWGKSYPSVPQRDRKALEDILVYVLSSLGF